MERRWPQPQRSELFLLAILVHPWRKRIGLML
jgi:hypothetical protein